MLAVTVSMSMVSTKCSEPTLAAAVCVRNTAGVFARTDTLRAEDIVQVSATVGARVSPVLNGLEHRSVGFIAHIPENGVMEYAQAVVKNFLLGNVGVLPGVKHTGSDILNNRRGNLSGGFVENIGKVVLGKQRVGGISAVWISPWLILVLS